MHDDFGIRITPSVDALADTWKPIATAPRDGQRNLLFLDGGPDAQRVVIGCWHADSWLLELDAFDPASNFQPSHWIAIPKFTVELPGSTRPT